MSGLIHLQDNIGVVGATLESIQRHLTDAWNVWSFVLFIVVMQIGGYLYLLFVQHSRNKCNYQFKYLI